MEPLSSEEREKLRAKLLDRSGRVGSARIGAAEREQIARMALAGVSQAEIARRYGVAHQTIAYHLRKAAGL